jgi:hypothetical protein
MKALQRHGRETLSSGRNFSAQTAPDFVAEFAITCVPFGRFGWTIMPDDAVVRRTEPVPSAWAVSECELAGESACPPEIKP